MEQATAQAVTVREDTSPGALIRFALERGEVDIEVLERLVALQERVLERDARAAFFDALHAFQEECPEIAKSRTANIKTRSGGTYSYTFAPLEEITRTIRPVLHRHGLAFAWDTDGMGDGALNVVCVLRHVDGHEERARFPVPTGTDAAMSDAQKNGAALTYGRRQSLVAVLGLTTADDADAPLPESAATITEKQIADLDVLIDDVGADKARFLKYMSVESLADITAARFAQAVADLEAKRGAK